ncbi:MAG: SulP family inorganic anion transporter [Steroidobacteraceae bacterium]
MQTPVSERFIDGLTPKFVTVLREGYRASQLRADLVAGVTVAIVALPLSMAIAIASGVGPERGLYAAIIGGFLVSLLGGSRHQIGGPAGAFIVLVAGTAVSQGVDGLILTTLMAGLILLAAGLLKLGTYIRYIPYPVTVGFTAGIAAIIFASQLHDLFGLKLPAAEPAEFIPKIGALAGAWRTASPQAILVAAFTVLVIETTRRLRPHWPNLLMAVASASVLAALLPWPVETIGTRFGGLPSGLPVPHLPPLSLPRLLSLLPLALSFALLGAIESLLSAVVADSMTGRRHRSNCELVAQGVANIGSALFGGLVVTGTIARTATNVRSGAQTPVAGMLHSFTLLVFLLAAAPLAAWIPLAALAGVLVTVAWHMAEKNAFVALLRSSRADAVVLLVTFGLTLFRNLMEGIVVGFALAALLFLHRMSQSVQVDDMSESPQAARVGRDTVICRISGAFFFGAAASVAAALDRIAERPRNYVLDFSAVGIVDSTAAATVAGFARRMHGHGVQVFVAGASPPVRRELLQHGVREPQVAYRENVEAVLAECRGAPS